MALLHVHRYPDTVLKRRCDPIPKVDASIRKIAADMLETMVAENGIGLAAPQIGRSICLMVVDVWWPKSKVNDRALVFINPKIVLREGRQSRQEGCLSLPGLVESVERAARIKVQAQDLEGKRFELGADGILAVCIQHEFDHLQGILLTDHLEPEARRLAVTRIT